ncbi:hypothetical protein FACS1894193_07590 [Bacilli bacterium]|nr:hypothetical protein FACS1894192_03420 [Bacilli bacterium]GHU42349.1 hypothetical protein FACS1894193_07590 [Bacilli bacterium]
MNKDIVFINPLAHVRYEFNPLGLQLLVKSCKDNGFNVGIIDLANEFVKENKMFDNSTKKWIEGKIRDIDSDMVGITVMNASLPWVEYIVKVIKNEDKNKKIILGGPQVTALQSELFKLLGNQVDYLVVYEGERVIVELIEFIKSEKSISNLPNNVYTIDEDLQIKYSSIGYEKVDFGIVEDIDFSDYKTSALINVEVGRGCPLDCYFCSSKIINAGRVEYKEASVFVEEAQKAFLNSENSKVVISFNHDNFLSNKRKFKEFANYKLENSYSFPYVCEGRIDALDFEMIDLLYETNCRSIFFGIESGSKKIQRLSRKNLRIGDDIFEKVKYMRQKGIVVELNFLVGFLEETTSDLMQTIELAGRLSSIDYFSAPNHSLLSPEPGAYITSVTSQADYILRKDSTFYKDLINSNMPIENYDSKFYNHLYMIKNDNYDIEVIGITASKYFEFLKFFHFTTKMIIELGKGKYTEIFEGILDNEVKGYISVVIKDMKDSLTVLQEEIITYELQRYLSIKGKTDEQPFLYEYPIQKIYFELLETEQLFYNLQKYLPKKTKVRMT